MEEVDWYIIEEQDAQKGPFTLTQIKDMLTRRRISPDTFVWHEELDGWDRLSNVFFRGKPALESLKEVRMDALSVPARLEVTPPASSRLSKNFVYEESKDKRRSRKTQIISGWAIEETDEGRTYYLNQLTGEVRFSAPQSRWQVFFDKECVWVPDAVEGYYPATILQRVGLNERLKVQRQGTSLTTELTGKAIETVFPLDKDTFHTLKHVRLT